MAQVYGCIECGMLFAGWEFCLAHIEHCRPQHYLEVDKKTLKEMCTIGHRRCLVPSYQPAMIRGNYGESEDSGSENDMDLNNGISNSYSESEISTGDTTMQTQDFLNPMERLPRLKHVVNIPLIPEEEQGFNGSQRGSGSSEFDGQDQMVLQLFDNESYAQDNEEQNLAKRSRRSQLIKRHKQGTYARAEEEKKEETIRNKAADFKKRMQRIEKCLHRLIQEASPIAKDEPKMVLLEVVPKIYEVTFGYKIDFEELGFPDLKALLAAIPSVSVAVKSPYYQIEHEYLCLTDPSRSPIMSWGTDESEEETHQDPQSPRMPDKYRPSPKNPKTAFPSISHATASVDSMEYFRNQKTPQHANHNEKTFSFTVEKGSSLSSEESPSLAPITEQSETTTGSYTGTDSRSRRRRETELEPTTESGEEGSVSDSIGISSCGSSTSVISALAEMLPSTNAFGSLTRVLAKNPGGITIGKLMLQAPEFKNFLSHCTDRRCEAQIKLAHTVLKQCKGISHTVAPDGSILYFQARLQGSPRPFSIVTTKSREESAMVLSSSASIEEQAAKLFAASEFKTPTPSPRHKQGTKEMISTPSSAPQDPSRRSSRLDTIASSRHTTPNASPMPRSRNNSPRVAYPWGNAPSTPLGRPPSPAQLRVSSPSTPMSREQSIAESAARILAHAQSMTTPTNKHNVSPVTVNSFSEEAARMLSLVQAESANDTPRSKSELESPTRINNLDYRADNRLYFFAEEILSNRAGSANFVPDRAASPITMENSIASTENSTLNVSQVAKSSEPKLAVKIHALTTHTSHHEGLRGGTFSESKSVANSHISAGQIPQNGLKLGQSHEADQATTSQVSALQSTQGQAKAGSQSDEKSSTSTQSVTLLDEKSSSCTHASARSGHAMKGVNLASNSHTLTASITDSTLQGGMSSDAKSVASSVSSKVVSTRHVIRGVNSSDTTSQSSTAHKIEVVLSEKQSSEAKPAESSNKDRGRRQLQGPSARKKDTRAEVIEKIAIDIFPTTKMHYQLLLALAENPGGITWDDIDALIPRFSPFVKKHGAENGIEKLEPWAVLQACVSVIRKQEGDSDLYFINAPKMMPSHNGEEETSVTSDMTDESTYSCSSQRPSALSLAFAGSDTAAALFFLRRIKEDFRGRVWPASWEQSFHFLVRLNKECTTAKDGDRQMFHSWLEGGLHNKRKALAKILDQLQRLQCVSWKSRDLRWDEQTVTAVVKDKPMRWKQHHNDVSLGNGDIPISFIETLEQLQQAKGADPFCSATSKRRAQRMVSVMCEGGPNQLYFILVGTESVTYIFDCVKLEAKAVCDVLSDLFANEKIDKAFHDVHSCVVTLAKVGGLGASLSSIFDTQLALEALTGASSMTQEQMFCQLGLGPVSPTHPVKRAAEDDSRFFGQRPVSTDILSYAADRLDLLTMSARSLSSILKNGRREHPDLWNSVVAASEARAAKAVTTEGGRHICYDAANGYSLASQEFITIQRPADVQFTAPLLISDGVDSFLDLLPEGIVERQPDEREYLRSNLSNVSVEIGRPAAAWIDGRRVELGRGVNTDDIENLTHKLDGALETGDVAGPAGQLHRVSAVRNSNGNIVRLDMTVGRHVTGAANMMMDLLFADPTRSILLIGESESGKTTILRDATRLLSEQMNVSVIDTNSEIGGYCHVPHSSLGKASRVAVHQREEQHREMRQCMRNQRPDAMVVDELDSAADVSAADYCKRRSTRLMASAVGSMEDLLSDPSRTQLLGGVKQAASGEMVRAYEPIFDVIVELRRGAHHEWRIIETADAVDATLSGRPYQAQVRTRDPETGRMLLAYEQLY